jgi:ureidoglycolate dehydrogenase (NAD+)
MIYFDSVILTDVMRKVLVKRLVNPVSIHHVVSSLVQTSLRGVDSHGINLFPHYCRAIDAGRINHEPVITITKPAEAIALVDADHAFGHHAGAVAMDNAIDLAKKTGMGSASVKNSTHFGAAAYFALRAPEKDCLGFAFTNADALVKAYGAKSAFFGTNPICFTAPMKDEEPFCLDMATSMVSWNKINNYRRGNKDIPSHWAFNEEGESVTDPHQARTLNPAGEYKGFDLGMMVDILCALLSGGPISRNIIPMYNDSLDKTKRCISHFFMAIDISRFSNVDQFRENLQMMSDRIRNLTPLDATNKVMIAGDPEKKSYMLRKLEGIPVDVSKYEEFLSISPEFEKALKS